MSALLTGVRRIFIISFRFRPVTKRLSGTRQQVREFLSTTNENERIPQRRLPPTPKDWHRPVNICAAACPPCSRPCFDITSVFIKPASLEEMEEVRCFLYKYYWPREPSIQSLYIPLCSEYIELQTFMYLRGTVFLAFEMDDCCNSRLIGMLIARKVLPFTVCEWQEWANTLPEEAERYHACYLAHCYQKADIHTRIKYPHVALDLSVVATVPDVQGQGVATMLIQRGVDYARDINVTATVCASNAYVKIRDQSAGCGPKCDVYMYKTSNSRGLVTMSMRYFSCCSYGKCRMRYLSSPRESFSF